MPFLRPDLPHRGGDEKGRRNVNPRRQLKRGPSCQRPVTAPRSGVATIQPRLPAMRIVPKARPSDAASANDRTQALTMMRKAFCKNGVDARSSPERNRHVHPRKPGYDRRRQNETRQK